VITAPLGDRPVFIHSLFEKPKIEHLVSYVGSAGVQGLLGLDIESTAFTMRDFWDDDYRLRLVQVATETDAWLLDPADPDTATLLADERLSFVSHTDTDPVAVWVSLGVDIIDRWIDSFTLARMTGRKPGKIGLKPLTAEYGMPELSVADAELTKIFEEIRKDYPITVAEAKETMPWIKDGAGLLAYFGYTHVDIHSEEYQRYSGLDAAACLRLLTHLVQDAKAPRTSIASELEVARENARLRIRGVRIDQPLAAELAETVPALYGAAIAVFTEHTGVNPNSPIKLREYFAEHGVDWSLWHEYGGHMTDKDAPSLGKKAGKPGWTVLYTFPLDDDGRKAADLYGAQLEHKNAAITIKQIVAAIGNDGRLHPKLLPLGTDTGRMSSRAPNTQNLKGRMRHLFLADEGHVLISMDFDGLEAKAAAAIAQDPAMRASTAKGVDFHQATADLLGIERKPAKTTNLAIMYGEGARALAASLGLTYEEGLAIYKQWWSAYSELSRLNQGLMRITDFVTLIDGRQIPVPKFGRKHRQFGEPRTYANLNYLLQGSSALLLKSAWLYICRVMGLRDAVLLLVHDELILQVPRGDVDRVVKLLDGMNFSFGNVDFTAGAAELYDSAGVSRWVDS
jgi:DNA polymerase-1